jgi:hypothetical protein
MSIYTNYKDFGGLFGARFEDLIKKSTSATIASGYTSGDIVAKYEGDFGRIAEQGGDVTLLLGMALFEGLPRSTYDKLYDINKDLQSKNASCGGVKVVWSPKCFHGKIYRFNCADQTYYFGGSSNFSRSGLEGNLEFTSQITDPNTVDETENYLNWLLEDKQSVNIASLASFPIIENVTTDLLKVYKKKFVTKKAVTPPPGTPYVDISLSRIDGQQRSSLNTFFGKGRWSRSTGIVAPRDWYEVEIIVDIATTSNPLYPEGNFTAHTVDGDSFSCRTQGDYLKNLRSRGDLKILGRWIKGKLQRSGALRPFEPVTSKTLELYGRDYIRLYQLSADEYLLDF